MLDKNLVVLAPSASLPPAPAEGAGETVAFAMPKRCPKCHCMSLAHVGQRQPDGSYAPGAHFRCVDCKHVFAATSPATEARRVKRLEWQKPAVRIENLSLSRAETILGTYRTWLHSDANGEWYWTLRQGVKDADGRGDSEEIVKAAAQADYEGRVLSLFK